MSLPYPSMVFTPFDPLTAEEMMEMVANIESLGDWSAFEDGSFNIDLIADGSVTPVKRSGGFKVGVISSSTFGSTGNKSITDVGFKPKLVRFTILYGSATNFSSMAHGAMDEDGNQFAVGISAAESGPQNARNYSTSLCINGVSSSDATSSLSAGFVSMDEDGFTINVSVSSSFFDVAYEAYG